MLEVADWTMFIMILPGQQRIDEPREDVIKV